MINLLFWFDSKRYLGLDLNVVAPDGTTVEGSWSYDRGYEFLKFTTSTSGTFQFEVDNFRWDAAKSSRNIGLAWHAQ